MHFNFRCGRGGMSTRALRPVSLLLSLFAVVLVASAQDGSVILPAREMTARNSFSEVQRQTGYKIAVDWEKVDPNRITLFSGSSISVKDLLEQALKETGYTWQVMGNQIAITYSPAANDGRGDRSVMDRNGFNPAQMKVVNDPWSQKKLTSEDLARVRNGFWKDNRNGSDSIGLAIVNYRVNRSILERDYMDNAKALDLIHRTFSNKDMLSSMDYIVITSASSPEGNTAANDKLAADRALAIKSYLMWKYPFMDRDRIYTFSIGEDWTGLRRMVYENKNTPYRDDVLKVLDNHDTSGDEKRAALKLFGGGEAYRYIIANMLPHLRGAAACMIYYKEDALRTMVTDTIRMVDTVYINKLVEIEKVITDTVITPAAVSGTHNPYYVAVKTNLLYDAALLPNLAFEFSLPGRWSVLAGGEWSWWSGTSEHYFHRIQVLDIEARKWLGKRDRTPLTGHYLGLYGMGGTYDVRFGETGYLSDWSYSAGITYGYSKPIGRRLNLEMGIGVGYFGGDYKEYDYREDSDCYHWTGSYERNYFGLTKAQLSLVWLIGSGVNTNKNK